MNKQRFAIISDLHSNLEAVLAVLKDIEKESIQNIYCLGDVIGYGPNPNELLRLIKNFKFTILGNHDEAVLNGKELENFNPIAAEAVLWTKDEIFYPNVSKELSDENRNYLQKMKKMVIEDSFLFAHGSALNNMKYIMNYFDAIESFRFMEQNNINVCFVGHSHKPGIFQEGNVNMIPFDAEDFYSINKDSRMIVNAGSVGQSRDNIWKACYVVVDGNRFFYRRVEYDVDKTIRKIYKIERLNNYLGNRLKH